MNWLSDTNPTESILTSIDYAKHAVNEGEKYKYFIVLILTDGVINDM